MDFLRSLRGQQPPAPVTSEDLDFADFAAPEQPIPVSIPSVVADVSCTRPTGGIETPVLYSKWYRVWERTKLEDFKTEGILLPFMLLMVLVHLWGTRKNKRMARKWMAVHSPVLESEFALVGYHGQSKTTPYREGIQKDGLLAASAKLSEDNLSPDVLKEKTAYEYQTYASGRQNVAFMDVKILLKKRMNPSMTLAESVTGMFFESMKPRAEKVEAVIYTFDGNEKDFVPPMRNGERPKVSTSSYDSFVFAVVNKMSMLGASTPAKVLDLHHQ